MQAFSYNSKSRGYDPHMPAGRPPTKEATTFGKRLAAARRDAGFTQQELADRVGVTQRIVAYWERESVGLKAEQLVALATALGTSVDALLGREAKPQRGGPSGRARRLFEQVGGLPRSQQTKILDTVETLIAGQVAKRDAADPS